jgi:hypothetical protein
MILRSSYLRLYLWTCLTLSGFLRDFLSTSHLPRACWSAEYLILLDLVGIFIMQFPLSSSYFLDLRSKYSPQHTCQTLSICVRYYLHIYKAQQINFQLNVFIFRCAEGEVPNGIAASIPANIICSIYEPHCPIHRARTKKKVSFI